MPVSAEYRAFVLEQLGRAVPVTSRSMFGGVGIYSDGLFFALIADDALYLKVDDTNRGDFESAGMAAFRPYDDDRTMQYYELPADLLEDVDGLRAWVRKSLSVATSARRNRR